MANEQKYCIACMNRKAGGEFCPHCGFSESTYETLPHIMRPRTILAGKYMVGKAIGEGGFGITYVGLDLTLDLRIAIKEFFPSGFVNRDNTLSSTVNPFRGEQGEFFLINRDKFIDEARRLARFRNLPGIVAVNDFFLENETAYIVMEYIDGQTFKTYLQSMGGKLHSEQVFEMIKPVMLSLQEVHGAGIIHRDISPDNIMISNSGYVKLIDFGAARDFVEDKNKSLSFMLKPGYSPEEQYRSKGKQGPWTDVYALCASMYRCITGVTPDESTDRVHEDEVERPSELGIEINPTKETILMKGMAVRQAERFASIGELMNALYLGADTYTPTVIQANIAQEQKTVPVFHEPPVQQQASYQEPQSQAKSLRDLDAPEQRYQEPQWQAKSLSDLDAPNQSFQPVSEVGQNPSEYAGQYSEPRKKSKTGLIVALCGVAAAIVVTLVLVLGGGSSSGFVPLQGSISAGYAHTIGLKSDGTVVAVGTDIDNNGQFSDYLNVEDWTEIVEIATDGTHTVGLKSDGTVVAVGDNEFGPIEVDDWTNIAQI